MITLIRQYYTVYYKSNDIYFEGTISILDNTVKEIFGPITQDTTTLGSIVNSNYITYQKDYKQIALEFIDNLKQELRNMGYVVE